MKYNTKQGHQVTQDHVLRNTEVKVLPGAEEFSIRVMGREIMRQRADEIDSSWLDKPDTDRTKRHALVQVLKTGSEETKRNLLSVIKIDELIHTLMFYSRIKQAMLLTDGCEFDSPESNKLLHLETLAEQVIKPLGLELEAEIEDLGLVLTISIKEKGKTIESVKL